MENKKPKILIVDDDVDLREMYAEVFKNSNFEVVEAEDGVDGLDKATKEMPDIVFTGIVMPRMDGFSMIESLQKMVVTSSIPIVISSHMGREDDRIRAEELGARDFIISGMTRPKEVLERISSLLTQAGEEYEMEFNPNAMDAQKLAKDLMFNVDFVCPECGKKIVLKLKLTNPIERLFEAKFICGGCGWVAK